MNNEQVRELIHRYNEGNASPEEQALLENWYYQQGEKTPLTEEDLLFILQKESIWNGTLRRSGLLAPRIKRFRWLPYAAAVVLCLMMGAIFFLYRGDNAQIAQQRVSRQEILPGGNQATLFFSDGQSVELRTDQKEIRLDGQQIVYSDGSVVSPKDNRSLTVKTPRGGQYKLVLPDGTQVWLNAESALTYPQSFGEDERKVTLHGEAYFDVAKGKNGAAFVVHSPQMDIKVLGTKFNVNAYPDEVATKTTLIEGSVNIKTVEGYSAIIKPGQQAYQTAGGIRVDQVDTHSFVAWKDGYFAFENTGLTDIVRQLSRWYAVTPDYSSIPDLHFTGGISRDVPLGQVLDMLEKSGKIEFVLNNNQLRVY
ncbi:FecR family protein [Sphingobacterium sp. SGG-5]|uniref:FecR family protein n=1 Tax=Sphingobacterium sp. SGG-5 TaxID=2710881 RepID=UPI0013EAC55B|nr:FecR domain-containing protein [Sphingobacterium sp. SGG-5]NGM62180.1 FecR family protein [Sphingobacterium sp. SGG-5]